MLNRGFEKLRPFRYILLVAFVIAGILGIIDGIREANAADLTVGGYQNSVLVSDQRGIVQGNVRMTTTWTQISAQLSNAAVTPVVGVRIYDNSGLAAPVLGYEAHGLASSEVKSEIVMDHHVGSYNVTASAILLSTPETWPVAISAGPELRWRGTFEANDFDRGVRVELGNVVRVFARGSGVWDVALHVSM